MEQKKCRTCGKTKPLDEFYKHKEMFDGYLNKCKKCVKERVGRHRKENVERIREYDRNRPNAKERSKQNAERIKNYSKEDKVKYRENVNIKAKQGLRKNQKVANTYLLNAIRDGRLLKKDYCERCDIKDIPLDGHHESYLKPLDVIWLCKECHGKRHKEINEEKRNK